MKSVITFILFILICISNIAAQSRISDISDLKNIDNEALSASFAPVPLDAESFWQSSEQNVYTTGMIWRDCNNDGYIDVFFANGNDIVRAQNFIYLSNRGSLPSSASWYSNNYAYSGHCAVGDIDDNGLPDFIVANYIGAGGFTTFDSLHLYYNNNGLPENSPSWSSDDSLESFSCALGDVDNDGDLDIAVATGDGYYGTLMTDRIYYNINGTFESRPSWESSISTAAIDVTWGDVDNDGDLDLAFCSDEEGAYLFINNSGVVETSPSWTTEQNDPANTLIFADANNDNWLDLIVAFNNQLGAGGHFRLFLNDGSGNLSTTPDWESLTGGYGSGVSVYDYDNDGDYDLAAGRWFDRPRIYENLGGTYSYSPVWRADESIVVEELAWVDVDADGVEIIVDTIIITDEKRLFYTHYNPLYSIDSVKSDGVLLTNSQFCFDLVSGWVSLGITPVSDVIIYYKYSFKNDLAVSDWNSVNSIFGNSNEPFVRIYADTTYGFVPFSVQFSDSSTGATQWKWQFGNGDSADVQNPLYIYNDVAIHDISLRNLQVDGWHYRIKLQMIITLADTLKAPDLTGGESADFEVSVIARNNYPVEQITIPFEYNGLLPLKYDSFSTTGCRTEYFESYEWNHIDSYNKRCALTIKASTDGTQPELEPGEGSIIKLYFHILSPNPNQTTEIIFDGYDAMDSYRPTFSGSVLNYQPYIINGSITQFGCCIGIRGNIDGSSETPPTDNGIDISDLVYFVEYSFFTPPGPEPVCMDEADVDGSGEIDIGDIVYMVEYMFFTPSGPEPVECP